MSADKAAGHLRALRAKGVGIRQAAKLSGLSPALVKRVRNGSLETIKADTEARILRVAPILAHGTKVLAWPTRRLLLFLRREDFSNAELARRLGYRSRQLQFDRHEECRITVKNVLKVRQLWKNVTEDAKECE